MALIGGVFHGFSKNWVPRNWGQMRELGSEKLGSDAGIGVRYQFPLEIGI